MTKIQAAIFIRVPYEIEDGEIIFDTELNSTVTFSNMDPVGYIDYGGVQGDTVDLRLILQKSALLPKEIPAKPNTGLCTFEEYSGPCKKPGTPWCEKHAEARCFECGKQAVKYCYWEGSNFGICGANECAEHSHEHA